MEEKKECKHFNPNAGKILKEGDDLRTRIVINRINMLRELPFFGFMAIYLWPRENETIPTACVTGAREFHINRKFMEGLSDEDMVTVLCHECLHLVTDHVGANSRMPIMARKSKYHRYIWSIATDLAINYKLFHPNHGMGRNVPKVGAIYEGSGLEKYWGKAAETIFYEMVQDNFLLKCPKCGLSSDLEGEGDPTGSSQECDHWWDISGSCCGEMEESDREVWADIIQSALQHAQDAGNLPGILTDLITNLKPPKANWRRELQFLATTYLKKKTDWKKRNRRTAAAKIHTPGFSPYLPIGVSWIDTSGSMSDDSCRRCISETAAIMELAGGEALLGLHDAEVYFFGPSNINEIKSLPVQRGGTDFRPCFERMEEEGITPAFCVFFSDMQGPFPEKEPNFPIIFCRVNSTTEVPWKNCRVIDVDDY